MSALPNKGSSMNKPYIAVGIIAVLAVSIILGFASNSDMKNMNMSETLNKSATATSVGPNTVTMKGLEFQQKKLTVKKGTAVTWRNDDSAMHNVIFDDKALGEVENGKLISKDQTLSYKFYSTGTFSYHCRPHPFMKAVIEVTE